MNTELGNAEENAEDLEGRVENTENLEQEEVVKWNVVEDETSFKPFQVTPKVEEITKEETTEEAEYEKETPETVVETAEEVVENTETEEEKIVAPQIDEQAVINFLKERGIETNTLDELKPKEKVVLDPETEAYLKYRQETGRSYQDFQELHKDWSKEPQEDVLRHILKSKNPNLDEDEIDFLFKKKYSFDSDLDDEDVVMEKKINLKTDYQEALNLLESQKEQYKVVGRSDEFVPEAYKEAKEFYDNLQAQQKENEILMAKAKEDFDAKTKQVFSENFEGFKFKVGEESFNLKPEDVNQTKSVLTDLSNFDKMFFDQQTGLLKDPQGYYKALYAGMNADKIFEQAFNLGKASQVVEDEKESKNVVVEGVKNINPAMREPAKPWRVVKD